MLIYFGFDANSNRAHYAGLVGVSPDDEFVEAKNIVISEPTDLGTTVRLRVAAEFTTYNGRPHSARATIELPKNELLEEYVADMAKVAPAGSPSRPGWYPLTPTKALFAVGKSEEIEVNGERRLSTPILKSVINGLTKGATLARFAEVINAEL